jgi:hypothetical protein
MPFGQPLSDIVWAEAMRYIGARSADELLSIKIRPLENIDLAMPQFFYDDDYARILEYMQRFEEIRQGPLGGGAGKAFVYRMSDGTMFVFGQHETGPEFIIYFNLVHDILKSVTEDATSVAIICGAVGFVVNTVKKLSVEKYAELSGVPDKSAISIETRTTRGAKVIRTFKPHSDNAEDLTIDPQDLQDEQHYGP